MVVGTIDMHPLTLHCIFGKWLINLIVQAHDTSDRHELKDHDQYKLLHMHMNIQYNYM